MRASHDPDAVVKLVADTLGRARGLRLTPDLADALGAALASLWPTELREADAASLFRGRHVGQVLDDDLIYERARNVATLVVIQWRRAS